MILPFKLLGMENHIRLHVHENHDRHSLCGKSSYRSYSLTGKVAGYPPRMAKGRKDFLF